MKKSFEHPITLGNWKDIPIFAGRLATKNDVESGKALFCTIEANGKLCEMDLPFCAFYTEKKTGEKVPIIAFQAEIANNEVIIGATEVNGETIVCTLSDLEIVQEPDQMFFASKHSKPWWKFW